MRFLCFNTSTTYSKPRFNPVFFFLPVIPTVLVQLIYRGIKTSEMTTLRETEAMAGSDMSMYSSQYSLFRM